MVIVPTYLKESGTHGIGCYACALMPEGTLVWEYNELIDIVITYDQFLFLPKAVQEMILFYAEWEGEYFIHCGDHGKFFNHDENSNLELKQEDNTWRVYAKRDIQEDEELLYDYRNYNNHVFHPEGKLFPISNFKTPETWIPKKPI